MTYEYVCAYCGHEFETEQAIRDKPLTECPECGQDKLTRCCTGGTGFILKGDGWESDGYTRNETD